MEKNLALLHSAAHYALAYMEGLDRRPVVPDAAALEGLKALGGPLPARGTDPMEVLALLHGAGSPATVAQTGGRYFGFVIGGLLPVAQAASWLADTWNQNTALAVMSPVAAAAEDACEKWVVQILGLPQDTAMGLVTGSANAIICALAAARNSLLARLGFDSTKHGLRNAPALRVVLGEDAHATVLSALSLLGFGEDDLELVPTDECGRMRPDALPALDDHTLCLVQAGNVNGGHYDPIDEICTLAGRAGAWVHVDGAFGLWAAASRRQRHLVKGLQKADSWSADAHKTLNAGYDCGLVLCRHREALVRALQARGAYIPYGTQRDGMLYSTEMSRRARAIPLWAVLRSLGAEGVEALVDRLCDNTALFADLLAEAGFELVAPACFNQLMVACRTEEQTAAVLRRVQESGECWCGASRWKGRLVLRVSVCSHATTPEDIRRSAAVFARALEEEGGR